MCLISATSFLKRPAKQSPAPTVVNDMSSQTSISVVRPREFADVDQLPFALQWLN